MIRVLVLFCMIVFMTQYSPFLRRLPSFAVVSAVFLLCETAVAKPQPISLLSTVPLGTYISGAPNSQLGFIEVLNPRVFISMKHEDYKTKRNIDFWDLRKGRVKARITPPEEIYAYATNNSLRISPDQKLLLAINDGRSSSKRHKIFIWDIATKKLARSLDLGTRVSVDSALFLPFQSKIIRVTTRNVVNIKTGRIGDKTLSSKRNTVYINIETGRKVPGFSFVAANFLQGDEYNRHSVMISPDQKRIVNIYEAGEGSYNSIEVGSLKTGKSVSRFQGNYDVALSGIGFFLSNEQLLFGSWRSINTDDAPITRYTNYIMNIRTGQARPCAPKLANLKCLAGIASRPGLGFFQSAQGVELWNVPQMKLIHRWSHIKHIEDVYVSRDQKAVGFYYWREAPPNTQGAVALDENGTGKMAGSETLQFWALPS